MPSKGTGLDTEPDERPTRSNGVKTPALAGIKKFARRDSDTAIGTTRQISDGELRSWSKGKRL